jgi:oligopeptide/dipeptide ABC transporter ATP-binding protein
VNQPLLSVRNLSKTFTTRGRSLAAVCDISLEIGRGETLGIVGESGCGKSTLGRMMLRLIDPSAGTIHFDGHDITRLDARRLRPFRARMQIVFQDPYASLNPRMRVDEIIAEPLVNIGLPKADIAARIIDVLKTVGLPEDAATRHPHAFSGGQRQRIGIARALAPKPEMIVCDEAVSALDVSVQAQILTLLKDIQSATGATFVFISHNLGVVRYLCDHVAVLYLGRVVEIATRADLFDAPQHPYTHALLAAIPEPGEPRRRRIPVPVGETPNPIEPPSGCPFHPRCPRADTLCRTQLPALKRIGDTRHLVACHHYGPDETATHSQHKTQQDRNRQ